MSGSDKEMGTDAPAQVYFCKPHPATLLHCHRSHPGGSLYLQLCCLVHNLLYEAAKIVKSNASLNIYLTEANRLLISGCRTSALGLRNGLNHSKRSK